MTSQITSPKETFQQTWIQHAGQIQPPVYLKSIQQQGLKRFSEQTLPDHKAEHWKYLNLNPLWAAELKAQVQPAKHCVAPEIFHELDTLRIVLINNDLKPISTLDTPELSLCRFSQANSQQQALISQHLGEQTHNKAQQPFADLNQALMEDGLLIEIKSNQSVSKPILIQHYLDEQAKNQILASRILVVAQAHSKARIIEVFHNQDDHLEENALNNLSQIHCATGAHLEHNRLQLTNEQTMHLCALKVNLAQHSEYRGFNLCLGSKLSRNDIQVNHLEGNSHCELDGVYLPKNQQQVDFHTSLEHAAAHCTSSETFRGIINHQAKATFNGRIHIHPGAQKTDARLSNKNLLLDNRASINTKPELEIYADDVVCAHGATVAQIDEESIFYLMSRGVSRTQAEILLSFGFINELFEKLTDQVVAEALSAMLAKRFEHDFLAP